MDRNNGVFSRPEHDLYGHSFVGKILVFASCKGGIATSWALLDLQARGLGPLALIFGRLNPVVVQGAVLAGLPLLHSVDPDPVDVLRTGDVLRIEPSAGLVILLSRTFE